MENIIKAMNWRYATKKFDVNKKINDSLFSNLEEVLRLSPSSYGLQPWKFIVIKNKEVRESLKEATYGQDQIADASHLIIFANKTNINNKLVDEYIKFVAKEKGIDASMLNGFSDMINGVIAPQNDQDLRNWASRQVYLAAGFLISSCAVAGIDTCPMEGFDRKKVDEILGLEKLNLESRLILALGYRDQNDKSLTSKKIRFPKEDVFIENF